jgi:NarL family two-component system response regulator LiaR
MDRTLRILLVEDHPLTRCGLALCLRDRHYRIIGEAGSLDEARRIVQSLPLPDLVVLDLMLGEENGLDFLPYLREFCKDRALTPPAVLVCSVFEDPFRIRTAMELGASAYISKSACEADFLEAVEKLSFGNRNMPKGEFLVNPRLLPKITEGPDIYARFTGREKQILGMVKRNYTNQRIAGEIDISLRTVENHISHIYLKSGCRTRQQLMEL